MMTLKKYNNVTCHIISGYAPTTENTVKNPEETSKFYDELTSIIKLIKRCDTISSLEEILTRKPK